jgi:hypothetical protein
MDQGPDLDRKKWSFDSRSAPACSIQIYPRYFTPVRHHMQTRWLWGTQSGMAILTHIFHEIRYGHETKGRDAVTVSFSDREGRRITWRCRPGTPYSSMASCNPPIGRLAFPGFNQSQETGLTGDTCACMTFLASAMPRSMVACQSACGIEEA